MIRPCVKKMPTIKMIAMSHNHMIAWYNLRAFSRFSSTDSVRRWATASFSISHVLLVNMIKPMPRISGPPKALQGE